jgi:N4-gp56 family major capsid protein
MATTLDYTNAVDTAAAASFIPEVWSMEIVAAYKKALVMAQLVSKLNHKGKRGDTINIPSPARGDASQKTGNNVVSLVAHTDSNITVSLNQHWEYSRVIEDIVEMQGLPSLRKFFTDDAGYALAKRTDSQLHALAATWGAGTAYSKAVIGSDGETAWDPAANANAGNGAAFADAGIRRIIQDFDDNDVPMVDRVLVIPPVEKRKLLGVTRFTEQAFTGEAGSGNSIRNGRVGDVYGVEVFVSSNCADVVATDTTTDYKAALFFQKDALVLAEQLAPRVQTQYKLEALGTLMVADTIFGVQTLRGAAAADEGAGTRAIIVPA